MINVPESKIAIFKIGFVVRDTCVQIIRLSDRVRCEIDTLDASTLEQMHETKCDE